MKKRKETLLEKAKKLEIRKLKKIEVTEEHLELGLAWMKGEITLSQMNRVLGENKRSGNGLYAVAVWLREAYKQGKIKIK